MKYQMKQKIWTLGDKFTIKDETGQDVFLVEGKVLSLGDKLSFQDMDGNELAYISQRLLTIMPAYEIYRNGQLFAQVDKKLSLFWDAYEVDIPGPNDYQVSGDFWDHEYEFIRGGQKVAQVSKRFFSWADTYGIQIADGEDDVTILATAVVIDLVNHDERDRRRD